MDENKINNIACLGINCTASCAGFFKVLNERWEGKPFAFFFLPFPFFFPFSFVSLYLIIQLKYPENYHERLRTRQVNWIWKCNLVTFLGADIWTNDGGIRLQCKWNNIRNYNIAKQIQLIKVFRNSFLETVCIFQKWFYPCPIAIKFSPVIDYELEFVKMQF